MNRKAFILLSYLIIVTVAEVIITYQSIILGLCIYAVLLMFLVGYSSLYVLYKEKLQERIWEKHALFERIFGAYGYDKGIDLFKKEMSYTEINEQNFIILLKCLTLAPLIRILSVSMPISSLQQIHWYIIINFPLFMVISLMIKSHQINLNDIGLRIGKLDIQLSVALTGFVLGIIDFLLLRPSPLIKSLTIETFIVPALILLIFTGLSEELIFRGIIQRSAERVIGNIQGLLFTSILFASMHIGWKSIEDLVFVFFVGLFYGYIFQKTRCILGITISHGITNITMFLLAPFLW